MTSKLIPELTGLTVTVLTILYFLGCAYAPKLAAATLGSYSKLKWLAIVPVFLGLSSTLIRGLAIVLPWGSDFGDSEFRGSAAIALGALGALLMMVLAYAHAHLQSAEHERVQRH